MGLEVHSGGLLPLECIDWDIAAVIWTEERMAEWHRMAKQSGQLPTGSCPVGFFTKCSEVKGTARNRIGLQGIVPKRKQLNLMAKRLIVT